MPRRSDLFLLEMSAICVAVVAFSSSLVVDVIAGVPLTIYLPGAALVSAFGPRRHHANVVERQFWIVGASLSLTVLGGIVLNLAGGLTRSSWLVWVGTVVVVCIALKPVLPGGQSRSATDSRVGTIGGSSEPGEASGSTRVSLRQGALLLGAGVICVASLVLSVNTNAATTRESFVQAWVLPRPTDYVASTSVQVGVRNHLGRERTFLVDVNVGSGPTKAYSVSLADGATWTQVITRHPGERVESTVFIPSKPWVVVLAQVYLATPVT